MKDNMKRTVLTMAGVLVVIVVLFVNAIDSEQGPGKEVGDIATDFNLKNIDGNMISLKSDENAKGHILVFTCNTCPYAKMYEQRVIDLDKKYRQKGFSVIAINPNDVQKQPGDSFDEMKIRYKDKGFTFPYLRDDTQEIAAAYGATKTPHVYILNKESSGSFRIEYIGAIDDSPREALDVQERYVEAAVDALLEGKKPEIKGKRAIGCTIKWRDS
jgi:peroxiredoxin